MSDKKARYVGPSQTGVDLSIPIAPGDFEHVHVVHGGELPVEVNGRKVPVAFRDGLLEQPEWHVLGARPGELEIDRRFGLRGDDARRVGKRDDDADFRIGFAGTDIVNIKKTM